MLKQFACYLDPKVWLGFVIGITLAFVTGCMHGEAREEERNEAAKNEKLVTDLNKVRSDERKINESQNNVAADYEKEIAALTSRANSAEYQLDRLRVKARTCPVVPTSNDSGKSNATAATAYVGAGTGEINLDDVARQIKQLGLDLDAADAKTAALQKAAAECEKATKPVE